MRLERLMYRLGVMNEPDCPSWVIEMDEDMHGLLENII